MGNCQAALQRWADARESYLLAADLAAQPSEYLAFVTGLKQQLSLIHI